MKRLSLFFLLCFIFLNTQAQKLKTIKEEISEPFSHSLEYQVLKSDKKTKHGFYKMYISGKLVKEGKYENDQAIGNWTIFGLNEEMYYQTDAFEKDIIAFSETLKEKESMIFLNGEKVLTKADRPVIMENGDIPWLYTLYRNIRYPVEARDNGEQGTAYVGFIVTKTGEVKDIKVIRRVSPSIDKESIRMVHFITERFRFFPAMYEGELVDSEFTIPISFKLE